MYQSLFAANQSQVVLADDFPYTALSTGIRSQFRAILSKGNKSKISSRFTAEIIFQPSFANSEIIPFIQGFINQMLKTARYL